MQSVDDATTFTDRITLMRVRRLRMSCEALGRELGVTGKTVARWEAGESDPPFHKIVKLAKLADEPIERLAAAPTEIQGAVTGRYPSIFQLELFNDFTAVAEMVVDLREPASVPQPDVLSDAA